MGWFSKSSSSGSKKEGGPRVRTGPTKGQVRSRAKDGHWRSKRSDAGKRRK